MSLGKTLKVFLAADSTKFDSTLTGAQGKLSGFSSGLLLAGAAAGAFALKLAVDGVQAAIEEEAALTRMNQTLDNLGFGAQSAEVQTFIDALQRTSGVADDELRPAFDRLVRSTGSVEETQRALKIAMDTAAGTGKSLQQVSDALGKAYDGNTVSLGKLGLGLTKAELATMDMGEVTGKLSSTFAGQADKAAGTYQGQINRLSVGFDELKESFGSGFLKALGDTDAKTDDFMSTLQSLEPLISDIGDEFGTTASQIVYIVGKLTSFQAKLEGMTGPLGFFYDKLKLIYDIANPVSTALSTFARILGYNADALDDVGNAAGRTADRLEALAPAAKSSAPAVYDSGIAAASAAERLERMTKILGHAPGVYETTEKAARSYGSSTETTSPLIDKQTGAIQSLIEKLGSEKTALDAVVTARNSYAASLSAGLKSGGAKLSDFLDPNDVAGSTDKYIKALALDAKFSDQFSEVGQTLGTSAGAQELLGQISNLGTESGAKFLAGLTPEIAGKMVSQLDESIKAANSSGFLLADTFYNEGTQAAISMIDGTVAEILKSEKKLRQIGKNIGKPIGANIKAEIADAVADALEAAENARSAAAARASANAAASNVTSTAQSTIQVLNQILNDSNNRAGYYVNPTAGVFT